MGRERVSSGESVAIEFVEYGLGKSEWVLM